MARAGAWPAGEAICSRWSEVGCLVSTAVLLVELRLLQYRAGWLGRSALSPEPESGILRPARLVPRWGWVLRG